MYKDQEEEDKERPRESLKMIKNAKKREKKQVKVKRVKVKPDTRRLRQQARRERQHERQVRKRARQVRKREAMSLRSEKKERAKQKGHKGRLVDQEVKRILMRAPLKASGRPRSSCKEKAEEVKGGSDHGWKAGSRKSESEIAPAKQSKKMSTSLALKLLKKAMKLAAKDVAFNASKTDLASPEVEEKATPSQARHQTESPPIKPDQEEQDQLSETLEDQGADELGVVLEDIGPDLCTDMPEISKRAGVTSRYIVGLTPDNSECKGQADTSPFEKIHQEQQAASVVLEPDQEERVVPGENSNFEEQDSPNKAEKAKLRRRRRRRREHAERRTGGGSSSEDEEESERKGKPKLFKGLDKSMPSLTDSDEDEEETESSGKAKVIGELTESSDEEPINGTEPNIYIGDFRGGGAGGSNYYVWLQMARRIMVGVRRAQLPLTLPLNDITEGDGNCYFRAVLSQCQRPEVAAPEDIKHLDHLSLRRKICNFMLKSQLPVVLDLRQRWPQFRLGDYGKYWKDMGESRGDIWAEFPVIHATAWYLERHIHVVSELSTVGDRYIPFCGNQDGSDRPCAGAALWLGHLTGLHYQTLMLDKNEVMPPPPKMQTIEDTLKSKAKATVKRGHQETSEPGTSRNSSEVKVSAINCLSNSSS